MKVSFSNKELQNLHEVAEQSIASRLSKLDETSNDIKALEAVLSKSGISVNFLYRFAERFEKKRKRIREYDYVNVNTEIQHYVVWNRDKQRLLYEIHEIEREIVDPSQLSYREWGPYIVQSKPLIETKTHIRLKVQPELQFFYSQIIKLLGQGEVQESIVEQSPNLGDLPF